MMLYIILLILYILFIFLIVYVPVSASIKKKKIRKNGGTKTGIQEAEYQIDTEIKDRLFGFDPGTAVLVLTNIFLALFAILSYISTVTESEKIHRPYIGLESSNIQVRFDFATSSSKSDGVYVVTKGAQTVELMVRNYGDLPAEFTSEISGWPKDKILNFQDAKNYIMPNETLTLRWNLLITGIPDKYSSSITNCTNFNNIVLTMRYLNHTLEIKPEYIDEPRVNTSSADKRNFDVIAFDCPNKKMPQVLIWHVTKSD